MLVTTEPPSVDQLLSKPPTKTPPAPRDHAITPRPSQLETAPGLPRMDSPLMLVTTFPPSASAAEQTANKDTTGTKRSCDHTKALSAGDCAWTAKDGFTADACDNVSTKCGSAAEQTANKDTTGTKRSCDHTKAL